MVWKNVMYIANLVGQISSILEMLQVDDVLAIMIVPINKFASIVM